MVPNLPTGIKNQLAGLEYLSYANINNIGKYNNPADLPTGNKRNSRFSKRLLEMQKALELQDMKMMRIQSGKVEENIFNEEK